MVKEAMLQCPTPKVSIFDQIYIFTPQQKYRVGKCKCKVYHLPSKKFTHINKSTGAPRQETNNKPVFAVKCRNFSDTEHMRHDLDFRK